MSDKKKKNRNWFHGLMALVLLSSLLPSLFLTAPALAAGTTSVTIIKYDAHGAVIGTPLTVTWEQMRDSYMGLPVYGDGTIHYYCEGPNFDDARTFNTLWDPTETGNIDSRDYGAAKGTDIKDLCELVGGAAPGDTIITKANDGWSRTWDYKNIYTPDPRFGRLVLTWYTDSGAETGSGYVPDDYTTGMRLLFFTDITDATGRHVFGNYDAYETMPENHWYFYYDGQFWPTTSGMSGKWIRFIEIRQPKMVSCDAAGNARDDFSAGETVYVKGAGLAGGGSYKLWIQPEPAVYAASARGNVVPGCTIPAALNGTIDPSGSQETVATNASGDFAPTAIWTIPSGAALEKYDIVADNQGAGTVGTFDNNDSADSPGFQGFSIVEPPPAPVAAFTSNIQSGTAPLTVNFTDQSTNSPTSWAWDFDNNGSIDSYDQNPTHVYSAGTYTVKLTATNAGGSDDEIKTDYISVEPSSQPDWDLNGDHVCNIGDVVKVGLKWGLTGTPGWIPEDLNNDGVINIGDIVKLGLHWGETW